MAKAQVFGKYNRNLNFAFQRVQKFYLNYFLIDGPQLTANITPTKYTLKFESTELIFKATIKGDLDENKAFDERTIKLVKFEQFDALTGELEGKAIYKGIESLTLQDFLDPAINSFEQSFSGRDKITGEKDAKVLLTGLRGNDKIFLKSRNLALGGAGKDEFILSKDTRGAQILDFNVKKDSIIIADDLASNYQFVNTFGQLEVQNLKGDTIAFVDSFNDPDTLMATQTINIL